jgi:hypothetical protein
MKYIHNYYFLIIKVYLSCSQDHFKCAPFVYSPRTMVFLNAVFSKCCVLNSMLVAGTDDDLPQFPHKSIRGSGRVSGNGRAVVPAGSYARAPTDMVAQVQQLEQEAYRSVLRAFKAQSDAITWVETIKLSTVYLVSDDLDVISQTLIFSGEGRSHD